MWSLVPQPFTKLNAVRTIGSQLGVEDLRNYDVPYTSVVIVLVWATLFIYASYKIIEKRDLWVNHQSLYNKQLFLVLLKLQILKENINRPVLFMFSFLFPNFSEWKRSYFFG